MVEFLICQHIAYLVGDNAHINHREIPQKREEKAECGARCNPNSEKIYALPALVFEKE